MSESVHLDDLEETTKENLEVPQSGLTNRSFLAILYGIVVFQPAMVWLFLTAGTTVSIAGFSAVLVFSQIARITGNKLTKQEGTIIGIITNQFTSGAFTFSTFLGLIYASWLRRSPAAFIFGLTESIPTFYSPPIDSAAYVLRSLIHPDWYAPLSIAIVSGVSSYIFAICMAYIASYFFIKTEKLDFPLVVAGAEATITITEETGEKLHLLSLFAFIGAIYGVIAYAVPFITSALGPALTFIPLPWADLTFLIEPVFPGAAFGVGTTAIEFTTGLLLPMQVVVSMFAGSMSLYFFGNYFLVNQGITEFADLWYAGMPLTQIYQFSILQAWISVLIGIGMGAAIFPLLRIPRMIKGALKSLSGTSTRGNGNRGSTIFLLAIVGAVAGTVLPGLVGFFLIEGYPVWFLLLFPALSFILSLAGARALGVTGNAGFLGSFSYVRPLSIIASGYQGVDIWFTPGGNLNTAGAGYTGTFKYLELTNTTLRSMIKSYFIFAPISFVIGFFTVQAFWLMAPMPSGIYPYTEIQWPVNAYRQLLWITRPPGYFRTTWIIGSLVITAICDVAFTYLHIPISMIGFASGATVAPPYTFTILLGGIAGKFFFPRIFGKKWPKTKYLVAGGFMVGLASMITLGAAIGLIMKSLWPLPY